MQKIHFRLLLIPLLSLAALSGCGDDDSPAADEDTVVTPASTPTPTPGPTASPTPGPTASPSPSGFVWRETSMVARNDIVSQDCMKPTWYTIDIERDGDYELEADHQGCSNRWAGRLNSSDLAILNLRAAAVVNDDRSERECDDSVVSLEPRRVQLLPSRQGQSIVFEDTADDGQCWRGNRNDATALKDEIERIADKIIAAPTN